MRRVGLETECWTCWWKLRARDQVPVHSTDKTTIPKRWQSRKWKIHVCSIIHISPYVIHTPRGIRYGGIWFFWVWGVIRSPLTSTPRLSGWIARKGKMFGHFISYHTSSIIQGFCAIRKTIANASCLMTWKTALMSHGGGYWPFCHQFIGQLDVLR